MTPAKIALAGIALVPVSVALSFIHPWGELRAASADGAAILSGQDVPPDVRTVLDAKCGDCHSNGTRWPLYSRLAPGSWLMEHDVSEGRSHMNLSAWPSSDAERQIDLLARIGSEIRNNEMPVKQYLFLHPSARLTDAEVERIYAWTRAERKRLRAQAGINQNAPATKVNDPQ